MSGSREARESEKVFNKVWSRIQHLAICIWAGKHHLEDVKEMVDLTKSDLDAVVEYMEKE